jgi:hypothetical protein
MIEMMPKWFSALLTLGVFAVAAAPAPLQAERAGLRQVHTVYLLPMGYGLDQYLANRLTSEGVFEVVTDPKRADAVLTDQLGVGFERRFEELFPPEPAPSAAGAGAAPPSDGKDEAKPEDPRKESDAEMSDRLKRSSQLPVSSFSRGKGNVFLVDVKSRGVVWSLYERPKKVLPDELDRTSARIVQQLKKDISGKP